MISSILSGLPFVAFFAFGVVIIFALLVFYALRNKGDVFAELTHGKTSLRFDARDKRET